MPSSSERLLMSLARGGDLAALLPAGQERPAEYVPANTNKKENLNGYL